VDGCGVVDPDDVRRAIRPNTKLITIMFANNETGVVQPVAEVGRLRRKSTCISYRCCSGGGKDSNRRQQNRLRPARDLRHKFHGPQGVGALYARKGTQLEAMLYGGSHERSRRAGTENVPGIVGLGKAAELAIAGFGCGEDKKIAALRDELERELLKTEAASLNGEDAPRVPNTTNICFEGIEGEALVIALDLKGLAVSTGAACSSGAIEPSHVLTAMGLSPNQAKSSIRLSLGKQNSAADVEFALELIPETVARLRELSPVWNRVPTRIT